jgi:hypothetical protein
MKAKRSRETIPDSAGRTRKATFDVPIRAVVRRLSAIKSGGVVCNQSS